MAEFDWYSELYRKAVKTMSALTGKKYIAFLDWHGEPDTGWLDWFKTQHPELYKKYLTALEQINKLWGNNDPQAMEQFKAAVKVEVEATQWAIDRFLEHQAQMAEEARLIGRQEALGG